MEDQNKTNDVIVLNRMYAGSYLSTHLGHEVINMFQADNGKHYLYLNSKGNFDKRGKKASSMFLVMHLGGKRVEILALAKELKPVTSAECSLPRDFNKIKKTVLEKQRTYILGEKKNEKGEDGGIHYGGVPLLEMFGEKGQQNIFVSYEVERENFFKPKKRLVLCFDENEKQEGDYLLVNHNFGSTTLHQYIQDGNQDYETLISLIKNTDSNSKDCLWQVDGEKVVMGNYNTHKVSLFDICRIRHDENCFSDALAYYMEKYPKLWSDFFKKHLQISIDDNFSVSREVDAKVKDAIYAENTGGRIDLLLKDNESFIIIENKVKSNINKIERDLGENQTQLDRYENYMKYLIKDEDVKQKQYYAFVLAPNYNQPNLDENKDFKLLTYLQICEYLKDKIQELNDDDFMAFYHAMRRHSFECESLCQYDDMKNIFYTKIEEYWQKKLNENNK